MSIASAAIEKIDDNEARMRVVEWLAKRFGATPQFSVATDTTATEANNEQGETVAFALFSDLYDSANPSTNMARALVGGYWIQVQGRQQTWDSFNVNKLLKDVGYGIDSISHRLTDAQSQKPALVRQTSKSGKSRQARKKYRLTRAGIKYVQDMLEGGE